MLVCWAICVVHCGSSISCLLWWLCALGIALISWWLFLRAQFKRSWWNHILFTLLSLLRCVLHWYYWSIVFVVFIVSTARGSCTLISLIGVACGLLRSGLSFTAGRLPGDLNKRVGWSHFLLMCYLRRLLLRCMLACICFQSVSLSLLWCFRTSSLSVISWCFLLFPSSGDVLVLCCLLCWATSLLCAIFDSEISLSRDFLLLWILSLKFNCGDQCCLWFTVTTRRIVYDLIII